MNFNAALDAIDARVVVEPSQHFQTALMKDIAECGIIYNTSTTYFVPNAPNAVGFFRPEYIPWMQARGAFDIFYSAGGDREDSWLYFAVRRM